MKNLSSRKFNHPGIFLLLFLTCAAFSVAEAQEPVSSPTTAVGCVSGNCVNGRGKYIYANGDVYEGDYINGKKEGQGKYTYKTGAVYIGQFTNNSRTGRGTYNFKNGDQYIGEFYQGRLNGSGIYFKTNNTKKEGLWKDNVFVGAENVAASDGKLATAPKPTKAANGDESELDKIMREEGIMISKEEKAENEKQAAQMAKGIVGDPDKKLKLLVQRGMLYIKGGKFDEALADGNEALKINSQSAEALLVRGLAKGGKKDYDGAVADFSQVVKISPARASAAYFRRGEMYEQKGDYSKAIADYNKAAEIDPKAVDAATKARLRTEARMNAAQNGTSVGSALTGMSNAMEAKNAELRKLKQYQENFNALQKEVDPLLAKLKATPADDRENQRIIRAALLPKMQAVRNYLADSIVELAEYKSAEGQKLRQQFIEIFKSVNGAVANLY